MTRCFGSPGGMNDAELAPIDEGFVRGGGACTSGNARFLEFPPGSPLSEESDWAAVSKRHLGGSHWQACGSRCRRPRDHGAIVVGGSSLVLPGLSHYGLGFEGCVALLLCVRVLS